MLTPARPPVAAAPAFSPAAMTVRMMSVIAVETMKAAIVRGGRTMFGPTFDRTKLDHLSLGLDATAIASAGSVASSDCKVVMVE